MREHARRKGGNEAGRQAVREERRERKEREKDYQEAVVARVLRHLASREDE